MATLSKRELMGVLMVIIGSLAALLFIGSLLSGWLWVRSAYPGPLELAAFWHWLSDPKERSMEPILVFIGLILSPVLAIYVRLLARLRATSVSHTAVKSIAAATPTEWDRIRGDLIRTVRSHWIDDYLRHSIFERIRIKLGVEKTPGAIDHLYDIERTSCGKTELVTNVSLLRLFDESGGLLLILGEPGSGKTVTLVQLAGLLLDRAASDPEAAVPVVVPLASWAVEKKPLEEWLRRELVYHYGLSARTTPALLEEGKRLILLLDGLDEVRESLRAECLSAIQRFKAGFAADIVVCCRLTEYQALPQKIPHGDAIRILPLTAGQVGAYFGAFGRRLSPLIQSLRERVELRELRDASHAEHPRNHLWLGGTSRRGASVRIARHLAGCNFHPLRPPHVPAEGTQDRSRRDRARGCVLQ
jgi:NACHT domain-containing protein